MSPNLLRQVEPTVPSDLVIVREAAAIARIKTPMRWQWIRLGRVPIWESRRCDLVSFWRSCSRSTGRANGESYPPLRCRTESGEYRTVRGRWAFVHIFHYPTVSNPALGVMQHS